MQRATGPRRAMGRRRRGPPAQPRDGIHGVPWCLLRRHRRVGRSPRNVRAYSLAMQQRASTCANRRRSWGCARVPPVAGGAWSPGCSTTERDDRHVARASLTGGPAMAAVATRGGSQGVGGLRTSPGGGHRSRTRTWTPTLRRDGVRHRRRHLLASRGGWPALGHVEPRRATRGRDARSTGRTCDGWQRRLAPPRPGHRRTLGIKKAWAATIEYTPDHLPLLGPLVTARRRRRSTARRSRAPAATA